MSECLLMSDTVKMSCPRGLPRGLKCLLMSCRGKMSAHVLEG